MNRIDFGFTEITKFYPYRTARVCGFKVECEHLTNWVKEFIEENGYKMDNHICFTIDTGLSFMYSDRCLYVDTKVYEENW